MNRAHRSASDRAGHERSQSSLSPPVGDHPLRVEPRTWMKEPCGLCPYSREGTLWLHPERAEDFAYNAANPYSEFPCHKTAICVEGDDDDCSGEYVSGERSLTCCGFLSLQVNENDDGPARFTPHPDAFSDVWEMIDHHTEHWDEERRRRAIATETRRAAAENTDAVHESADPKGIAQ